jgi:hypothetical protein
MRKLEVSMVICLLITGCAGPKLTVNSNPEGAYLTNVRTGAAYGVGPIDLNYDRKVLEKKDAKGCILVEGVMATWPSGAKTSTGDLSLCIVNTLNFNYTIGRNPNDPHMDIDLNRELQLQQARRYNTTQDAFANYYNNKAIYNLGYSLGGAIGGR